MANVYRYSRKFALLAVLGVATLAVAWSIQLGTAHAEDLFKQACSGGGSGAAACSANGSDVVTATIGKITNLVMYVSGFIAIITIMIGGYMYITANGDASKISEAKNTIIFTIIGLIVVVFARFIILFVISRI
ncbi:MAG TPA: pilin [Candidatus Saccharimonadales bacterium]|nr:pilin [Candidatus Saccharimonadales bacterium]